MRKLLHYLGAYKKETILGPLFKLLEASFELFVPLVIAALVDTGIKNHDVTYILQMCGILILLALIGLTCAVTAQYFAAKAAVGFTSKLRYVLFEHIQKLSFSELDTVGTSTMITRLTSDLNQVQSGVNLTLRLFLRSPFVVFGAMVMAFTINVKAALIFAVTIPVLSIVVFGIMLTTMPLYKKVQGALDKVLGTTRENLTGVRVIRAFNKEAAEIEGFDQKVDTLKNLQMFVGRISVLMSPITFVIVNAATLILIWSGAVKVDNGILTQGQVIALVNYMSQILVELVKLADLIIQMTKAVACGNRVQAVLEIEASQKDGTITEAQPTEDVVELDHVSLAYAGSGAESISDISLKVKRGQTIGIIGGTGSGKTSLVHLIARFYDATSGSVRIDGVNVNDYKKSALRDKIGIVMQKAVLFKGTIRENLLWGNEKATEEDLMKALEISQAKEFVLQKDGGLDAPVEQGGRNLSGGQRQRLTIARALVKNPEILILDDSASALDFATDAKLRLAIKDMESRPTTFIVSQRASSIRYADQIVVLEDGAAVGIGTHEELLKDCEVYQEIYYSQYPKEEVAR